MSERRILPQSAVDHGASEHKAPNHDFGIYNETDRLTRAAIWGPVGAEALIAQLLPTSKSLFYATMDVPRAREEAKGFQKALEDSGVRITVVRDTFAKSLPIEEIEEKTVAGFRKAERDIYDLKNAILNKAHALVDENREELQAEIDQAKADNDPNGRQRIWPLNLEADLDYLFGADAHHYQSVARAVALNKALILDLNIPMGDAIYARDQMNVLLGTRFICSMAKDIRKAEIPIYEKIYGQLGIPPGVEIPARETFEGGDAYVHDNVVYVGVGSRTTEGAARHIYKTLKPQLDALGYRFVMVRDMALDEETEEIKQQFMHLDTFSNPVGPKEMVVCEAGANRRRVIELTNNSTTGYAEETDRGTFIEFLERENDVFRIPEEAQREFACNFLALDGNTIFMADTDCEDNRAVSQFLRDLGKNVVQIPLRESTRGYGASHCMTGQLARSR